METQGKIGAVGEFDVKVESGVVTGEATVGKFGLSAGIVLKIDSKAVVDLALSGLEKAIPGEVDNAVLELLKSPLEKAVAEALATALGGASK